MTELEIVIYKYLLLTVGCVFWWFGNTAPFIIISLLITWLPIFQTRGNETELKREKTGRTKTLLVLITFLGLLIFTTQKISLHLEVDGDKVFAVITFIILTILSIKEGVSARKIKTSRS